LRSLIFPGLGHWYLGHRGFALLEMCSAAFLWLALVILPLLTPADPKLSPPDASYWLTAAFIILVVHGIDAMMTQHFARKGHHPGRPPSQSAEPPTLASSAT
jgi:hypothetical protein